jgi:aminoglycoside phosphotransferase (APT) family kinase protein
LSDIGDRLIASGNVADVFARGARVLKLYKRPGAKAAAFREAALHAAVEAQGLAVPAWGVEQVGDRWGVVFDRISGPSFAERMRAAPGLQPDYMEQIVRLQLRLHAAPAVAFPGLKLRLADRIAIASSLDAARRAALTEALDKLPDGGRLCHGDFHPLNILGDAERPMVIDWPDATRGDPAADCCRSYLILKIHAVDLAKPYLDLYCRLAGLRRDAVLRWLTCVAAARLAEEVPDETHRLLALVG